MCVGRLLDPLCDFTFDIPHDLEHRFSRSKLFSSHISRIVGPIDVEQYGCKSDTMLDPLSNLDLCHHF